jgi:hypothetical protein
MTSERPLLLPHNIRETKTLAQPRPDEAPQSNAQSHPANIDQKGYPIGNCHMQPNLKRLIAEDPDTNHDE